MNVSISMVLVAIFIQSKFVHICVFIYVGIIFVKGDGNKKDNNVAYLDPMRASRKFVDKCERDIEDQLINAIQSCNDDGLVLWPFNQK